jgi:hypothetical protein
MRLSAAQEAGEIICGRVHQSAGCGAGAHGSISIDLEIRRGAAALPED